MIVHPRYEPGAVLGRGAEGVVLRVTDREAPSRALVAKVHRAHGHTKGALEAEFALLSRRRIPGLVRAHDLARDARSGAPFIVEDFVDGEDFTSSVAKAPAAQRIARFGAVLVEIACTLMALHDAGFVHGDLKPAHVRIPQGRRAMLLDLGAAIFVRHFPGASATAFTRSFAAPEVLAGGAISTASDLYSLGATARAVMPKPPPALADVIEKLLAAHPRDRFESARALVLALGQVGAHAQLPSHHEEAYATLIGRDRELAALLRENAASVRYVIGPPGSGKSHLVREAMTRALLSGRETRLVTLPAADADTVSALIRHFRGDAGAWPFTSDNRVLLILDSLDEAPADLVTALAAHACRADRGAGISVVATSRRAREPAITLGPLDEAAFASFASSLGVTSAVEIARLALASDRMPGWTVAAVAGIPLDRDAVLTRVSSLSRGAVDLLSALAMFGAPVPQLVCPDEARAELTAAAIAERHGLHDVALVNPSLADDLADALSTFDRAELAATSLLGLDQPSARSLLRVANAKTPPESRRALLVRAIERARAEGLAAEETDAHFALIADPRERTASRLARAERLTRDAGQKEAHRRVLDWLDDLSKTVISLRPLALRRQAEKLAREGDYGTAFELVDAARALADEGGDPAAAAYAIATRGAIALYAADAPKAKLALEEARTLAKSIATPDEEEIARLDHNLGVVALYENDGAAAAVALERSLSRKRSLGDLAGVRSCLMNLGIAHSKTRAFDAAESAFLEATNLARTLGQTAGLGWCFVERAELALKRGRTNEASRFAAEAAAIGDALPAGVRADLVVVRAEIALQLGDATTALAIISELAPSTRATDATVDARARDVIARARGPHLTPDTHGAEGDITMSHDAVDWWPLLASITDADTKERAASALLDAIVSRTLAERAFLVTTGENGAIADAFAMDVDRLPITEPEKRVPPGALSPTDSSSREGPVHQRDIDGPTGRGSRVSITKGRSSIVLEHRFAPGHFDQLDAKILERFIALAKVVALVGAGTPATSTPVLDLVRSDATSEAPGADESTVTPLLAPRRAFPGIVGQSRALVRALARLEGAIDSDLPALVTGETGVGKELFCRAIHDLGPRAHAPFVAVNCAAIPDSLFEAELFGHARGAFTGADRARPGLLARAQGGTLLLDEVGELALARQASLLRVLESRRYRAVGADEERAFDVRIVAATNRDLGAAVTDGTFRSDLLFRLRVLDVRVPPLRERQGDVPLLARHFLETAGSDMQLTPRALDALDAYAWPGNVRELSHQMQRVSAMRISVCDVAHLSREVRAAAANPTGTKPTRGGKSRGATVVSEETQVMEAMDATGGNISRAATLLGLTRHGLKKKMLRLGLRAKLGVQR